MRALVQRVSEASVTVAGERVAAIGPGLLVLLGVTHDDDAARADRMADKVRARQPRRQRGATTHGVWGNWQPD